MFKFTLLRFDGFDDEWKSFKLTEISERITRKNSSLETDRPLTISAQYGLVDQIEFFNKIVASKSLKGYYLLNNGEFAYNKSYSNGYPFGAVKRLDKYENGAISTLYICFKVNDKMNSDLIKEYFETDKWYKEIYKIAVEGARNHGLLNIAVGDFFNTKHILPTNMSEQEKIANFLTEVNKKIDLLENKLLNYQNFKKFLMQQIFTQKLRFNEEEIWKTVEVSSVVSEYKEKAGDNDYPVLSSTLSGIFLQSDYFDKNVNSSDTQDYKVVPKGYFTYRSMSDTGIFRFNIQNIIEKGIISPAYPVFTTRNINKCFLEEYLNNSPNIKRQILTLKEGGTRYALGFNKFKKLKIELPSSNEQNKIADCLKTMNTKIDNANNELKYLIEFKKGLIQQMFV